MDNSEQIKRLMAVKLTSEPDVEQEFVTPLLRILGYDHLRGEIERAKALGVPYKSGTKRKEYIVPDYIIRAGDKTHFVLDAKVPGINAENSRSIVCDPGYVSQVYSYAAHREVNAPFFVITNGHYTAIYKTEEQDFEPILLVSQKELSQKFFEIENLISKPNVSNFLAKRLPLGWKVAVAHSDSVGYQPMNLDIGDVNHDGLPEIVIALSDHRIPVFDARGNLLREFFTDGWIWWVKCTHSEEAHEAVLIAIQHNNRDASTKGKILGIYSDGTCWEYELERAGSGFETLDKILIYKGTKQAIIGTPTDNLLLSFDLSGNLVWKKRIDLDAKFGGIMHLVNCSSESKTFLATYSRENNGYLIQANTDTGEILLKVELRFRGARVELLNEEKQLYVISSADSPELAIVSLFAQSPIRYIELPEDFRRPSLAVNSNLKLIAVGGMGRLLCFAYDNSVENVNEAWSSDVHRNHIYKIDWGNINGQSRLLIGTGGQGQNTICILDSIGNKIANYDLDAPIRAGHGSHSTIRDIKSSDIDHDGNDEIMFLSADTYLYAWRP